MSAIMGLIFKTIGEHISVYEKVFARGLASLLITLVVIFFLRQSVIKYNRKNKLTMEQAQLAHVAMTTATGAPSTSISTAATIVKAEKIIKPDPDGPVKLMATALKVPNYFGSLENWKMLVVRGITGTFAMFTYIYTCNTLSLADADMMVKLCSVFLIIISAWFLKEKTSITQFTVVVVSLFGAIFIIKPNFNNPHLFSYFVGLLGTLSLALTYIAVRKLTTNRDGEHPLTIECCLALTIVITTILPTVYYFQGFTGQGKYYALLILAALLSVIGQYTFTFAFKYAPSVEISVYGYSSLLWNCLFGFVFFATIPDMFSVIGYVAIVASGVYLFFYNKRRLKVISNIRKMLKAEAQARKLAKQQTAEVTVINNGEVVANAETPINQKPPIIYSTMGVNTPLEESEASDTLSTTAQTQEQDKEQEQKNNQQRQSASVQSKSIQDTNLNDASEGPQGRIITTLSRKQ
ncbi:DMT family transporter [Psittacicella gerlachiana]|uniref:EamA domain-containing protein n=1 Tax=Psittacicella gerlachiana TaxID=2028574 RepID=A0A3A1YH23_9GAMM|nr:DMT family transporter [Psittacicella gerlachiana]RIY37543.1 hypothetical protein CKF59_01525 [Psittacicella gerlachiana]